MAHQKSTGQNQKCPRCLTCLHSQLHSAPTEALPIERWKWEQGHGGGGVTSPLEIRNLPSGYSVEQKTKGRKKRHSVRLKRQGKSSVLNGRHLVYQPAKWDIYWSVYCFLSMSPSKTKLPPSVSFAFMYLQWLVPPPSPSRLWTWCLPWKINTNEIISPAWKSHEKKHKASGKYLRVINCILKF